MDTTGSVRVQPRHLLVRLRVPHSGAASRHASSASAGLALFDAQFLVVFWVCKAATVQTDLRGRIEPIGHYNAPATHRETSHSTSSLGSLQQLPSEPVG
jgi:hypothetical protein